MVDRILKKEAFQECVSLRLGRQLLSAVAYLHAECISHRDIKVENVLLKEDAHTDVAKATLKLIDFGMATRFPKGAARMLTLTGSALYVAPEVLLSGGRNSTKTLLHYNEKCDVWSAGVVLYMMLSGTPPFFGKSNKETLQYVMHSKLYFPTKSWRHIHQDARGLCRQMLTRSVDARPSAEDVLASWMADADSPMPVSPSATSKGFDFNDLPCASEDT